MSSSAQSEALALSALDLDDVTVGREDGHLCLTRAVNSDTTDLQDVLELIDEHNHSVENVVIDLPAGEARVWVAGGDGE